MLRVLERFSLQQEQECSMVAAAAEYLYESRVKVNEETEALSKVHLDITSGILTW